MLSENNSLSIKSSMHIVREIILVVPTLCGGGAERVMARMAAWWAERGTEVTLITFFRAEQEYPVPDNVRRVFLNDVVLPEPPLPLPEWPGECVNVARLAQIFGQFPPSVPVLSFLTRMNIRVLLAARRTGHRAFVTEQIHPPSSLRDEKTEQLRLYWYSQAEGLICLTRHSKAWGKTFLPEEKITIIPNNCLPDQQDSMDIPFALPRHFILAAGRLTEQKGFMGLFAVFASLARRFPGVDLVILGEGELRQELEAQRAALGLTERVHLPGFTPAIAAVMRRAECFVLPSLFEGFGNVLVECMSQGCPVVAFDCAAGPSDIVRHGIDGLLVPVGDYVALEQALVRMLENKPMRLEMGENAREVCHRFSEEVIMRQWNELLKS